MEMEPCRRPGEEWCKNKPNVATPQCSDARTSRRSHVVTSKCCDVAGKSQQTLSLGEAIKGTRESNCGVRNSFAELGFEELEFGTKERRLERRS